MYEDFDQFVTTPAPPPDTSQVAQLVQNVKDGNLSQSILGQIAKLLDDPDNSEKSKLSSIQYLLISNKDDILVAVEKYLSRLIAAETHNNQQKLTIIDRYCNMNHGCYTKNTVQWMYETSIELYWTLFSLTEDICTKIQCAQFILRNERQKHRIDAIVNEITRIANDPNLDLVHLQDLADFVLHYESMFDTLMGATLLQRLRTIQTRRQNRRRAQRPVRQNPRLASVYRDPQNVHDKNITESVKRGLEKLSQDVPTENDKIPKLLLESPLDTIDRVKAMLHNKGLYNSKIDHSLNRISTDNAFFTKVHRFRLRDILQRIWNRIENRMPPSIRDEAISRLTNELVDMSRMCSTGHMSRLVNVLSGFPESEGGLDVIRISWKSQLIASISGRVNARIRDMADKNLQNILLESIIGRGDERKAYTEYLVSIQMSLYEELVKEYEPIFDKQTDDMELLTHETFKSLFATTFKEFMNK